MQGYLEYGIPESPNMVVALMQEVWHWQWFMRVLLITWSVTYFRSADWICAGNNCRWGSIAESHNDWTFYPETSLSFEICKKPDLLLLCKMKSCLSSYSHYRVLAELPEKYEEQWADSDEYAQAGALWATGDIRTLLRELVLTCCKFLCNLYISHLHPPLCCIQCRK